MASSKIKLISAVSAVMFSLITCFTGVFSWFMAKGTDESSSDDFNVFHDPNILSFELSLYRYDYDLKTGYVTYENDEDFTYNLEKYDKFIPDRNKTNDNILRFDITFAQSLGTDVNRKVSFDFKCQTTVTGDPFDNGLKDGKTRLFSDDYGYKYTCESKTYVCNKVSDVIFFKVLPYTYTVNGEVKKFDSSITIDEVDPNNTYKNASAALANKTEKKFVDRGTKTKKTEIDDAYVTVNSQASSMVVYLQYCYNSDLVEDFLTPNEFTDSPASAQIITEGLDIKFQKDVTGLYLTSQGVKK